MKIVQLRNVPEDLHREAKAQAAKEGKTLQEWFVEAIKEKLEKNQK
ncbi:MAG: toxin-antitoxin system HicB family antitoxin [Acidobacteriota bacterium]